MIETPRPRDRRRLVVGIDVSAVPARPAGAGRYVVELTRALGVRSDVALELFARRNDDERWRALAPDPPHHVWPVAPASRLARVAYGELLLGRVAHRARPALALFHGPHYTFPRATDDPVTVTIHDLTMLEHPEWHERGKVAYFSRAIARAARRAAGVVVPNARDADRFSEQFAPRGEVVVIPHGVDHERFTPKEPTSGADRAVLDRLGVTGRYVATLGTIEPRKNHPLLVEAFGTLASRDPEIVLVIAGGEGWGSEALSKAIAASPVADRILRLGYLDDDDVPALLRNATCVAYPSSSEGFGLPALEVLASGSPLLTTSDTTMADLAGSAAIAVRAGDAGALADALVAIVVDREGVAERLERGIALAHAYRWEKSAADHVDFWARTVGSVSMRS